MLALLLSALAVPAQAKYMAPPGETAEETAKEAIQAAEPVARKLPDNVLIAWTPPNEKLTSGLGLGFHVYGVKDNQSELLISLPPRTYYAVVPGGYDGYYVKAVSADQKETRLKSCTFQIDPTNPGPTMVTVNCRPWEFVPFEVFQPDPSPLP